MSFQATVEEIADPFQPLPTSRLISLSAMGPDETSVFLDAWLAIDEPRRERIVHELANLAEDNVELDFDAVFLISLGDRDAEVRLTAIRGLWEHQGRDLIDPLLGLLTRDADAAVRAEAALALGRYVLQAEFDTIPVSDGERIEQALAGVTADASEVSEVRARALEALGVRTKELVRNLLEEAFDSDDRRLRIGAVRAMGRSSDSAWLPALIGELSSDDPEVRFEAAGALGEIADEEATQHLVPCLYDEDLEVQDAAIGALGEIGGGEAREALEELLERGDDRTREAVTAALAEVEFLEDPLAFKFRG